MTSEGVTVFLETALNKAAQIAHDRACTHTPPTHARIHTRAIHTQVLNIDPRKQTFSVKITGGTDGDVAGNEARPKSMLLAYSRLFNAVPSAPAEAALFWAAKAATERIITGTARS